MMLSDWGGVECCHESGNIKLPEKTQQMHKMLFYLFVVCRSIAALFKACTPKHELVTSFKSAVSSVANVGYMEACKRLRSEL